MENWPATFHSILSGPRTGCGDLHSVSISLGETAYSTGFTRVLSDKRLNCPTAERLISRLPMCRLPGLAPGRTVVSNVRIPFHHEPGLRY